MTLTEVMQVITAIASVPHAALPVTPTIAINALTLYIRHGGPRQLHYFDAFRVATARNQESPIITGNRYIHEQQTDLSINAIDLRKL